MFSNKSDTMFNNISWGSYLLITAVITAIYYFLIGVIYYRNEILAGVDVPCLSSEAIPCQ